jgi:hypothetical protein
MLFVTFKEKSHGRIILARLADRFRSPWKQTSEETMELVFCLSDSPIFPLDLLCPIVMYLKGTILLYESYLRILLVCFVGTARSSSVVQVNGRTVIVLPLPVAWSLALEGKSQERACELSGFFLHHKCVELLYALRLF